MVWSDASSVGNALLDAEHKRLGEIINRLYSLVAEAGGDRRGLKEILDDLVQYTNSHFFNEEAILRNSSYPHLEKHRSIHEEMRLHTDLARTQVERSTGFDEASKVLRFRNWWLTHINKVDMEYSPYVRRE